MKMILIFILAILLYGVKLKGFPVDLYRFLYLISPAYLLLVYRQRVWPQYWLGLVAFTILAFTYSIIVVIYTSSGDLSFSRMCLDYILTFFFVVPAVYHFIKNYIDEDVVYVVISIIAVQAVMMMFMLVFPSFQKFIVGLIQVDGHVRTEGLYRFRGVGLTGFASYSMAVTQVFGLFLFHVYWLNKLTYIKFWYSSLLYLLILVSALLSARTSFIFIVVLMMSFVILILIGSNGNLKSRLSFICLIQIVCLFLLGLILNAVDLPEFKQLYSWMMEIFTKYSEGEGFSTNSTNGLKTLFFMPEELTILFGDGYYIGEDGMYYMHTDVGYLRIVLFGGLFMSILFYCIFIYLLFLLAGSMKRTHGGYIWLPFLAYFLAVFVVNI